MEIRPMIRWALFIRARWDMIDSYPLRGYRSRFSGLVPGRHRLVQLLSSCAGCS